MSRRQNHLNRIRGKRVIMARAVPRLRVLDVGASPETSLARHVHPDDDIVLLNAPGLPADVQFDLAGDDFQRWLPEPFDTILASHVIEHLTYEEAKRVVRHLGELLKPYDPTLNAGTLLIKVPALEWAAEVVRNEVSSTAVFFHLYGAQTDPYQFHKWAYTLPSLRGLVQQAGLVPVRAGIGKYEIHMRNSAGAVETVEARENFVVGVRPNVE